MLGTASLREILRLLRRFCSHVFGREDRAHVLHFCVQVVIFLQDRTGGTRGGKIVIAQRIRQRTLRLKQVHSILASSP